MKINIYDNIFSKEQHLEYNSWKNIDSFPIEDNKDNFDFFNHVKIIEYVFEGVFSNRNAEYFKEKYLYFKNFLFDKFLNSSKRQYIFLIEHKPNLISRVRSFKGLINKKEVVSLDFQEKEFFLDEYTSIIVGVSEIRKDNIEYFVENFFFDDSRALIISSELNLLNEIYLKQFFECFSLKSNSIQIDYMKIIYNFVNLKSSLYRTGGDFGQSYWSLQEIKLKDNNINLL